jgi:hypothetical protein
MNTDRLYETETMAELCAKQGRMGEAIAIYRELLTQVADTTLRARFEAKLATLETAWQPLRESEVPPEEIPLPDPPATLIHINEEHLTVAWALSGGVTPLALDVLALQKSAVGIEVQKKLLPLSTPTGRIGLHVPGLHSATAAAGTIREGRFIPLAFSKPRCTTP